MEKDLKAYSSLRRFRICDYSLSHSQLLVRSPKTDEVPFNIDLIFQDVDFLEMPVTLHGIEINNKGKSSTRSGFNIYRINSGDEIFRVEAGFILICENDLELQETSLGVFEYKGRDKIVGTM